MSQMLAKAAVPWRAFLFSFVQAGIFAYRWTIHPTDGQNPALLYLYGEDNAEKYGGTIMMGYNFGFGGWFGMLFMTFFWVAIIVLAIWLVSKLFSGRAGTGIAPSNTPTQLTQPPPSADEILKQRYARGEITKEQFEEMRRNLAA